MPKIGKGLVKKQKENRESSGFITPDKVLDIKAHGGEWYRFAAETVHKINIIPWQIKSEKDVAYLMKGDFHKDIDEWVYSLNYWVHPRINDEKDILCLKKCFGKPCAICDKSQEKWEIYNNDKSDENKKAANVVSPKLRSMYNIEVLTDKLRGKNSFMEASDFIFEDELLEKATECEEGQEPVAFYEIDDEEGKIVKFYRPKSAMKVSKSFEFKDRTKPLSKKLLTDVLKFGELIVIPTEEEVSDFFYGANFVEKPNDDEKTIEEKSEEDNESEEVEETVEEDIEDYDNEDEQEEKKTSSSDSSEGKWENCPSVKKFGIEFGEFDACDECPEEINCHKKNKTYRE